MKRSALRSALVCLVSAFAFVACPAARADLITVSLTTGGSTDGVNFEQFTVTGTISSADYIACTTSGSCLQNGGYIIDFSQGFYVPGSYGDDALVGGVGGFSIDDLVNYTGIGATGFGDYFGDLLQSTPALTVYGSPYPVECAGNPFSNTCTGFDGYSYFSGVVTEQVTVTRDAPTVTPEPGTWVMVGTGLVGCLGVVRRRLGL